ncbi:MAG: isochorismatase family protein [Gemmatimonadetes bacterium]|nr:isochorismatase family protein [Gemmatimonadota bacterium]
MSGSDAASARPARIGWVVDVQKDFMEPEGRLYVHDLGDPADAGAVQVRDRIVAAVRWMEEHCDLVVFTGDWHGYDDAEIDPDAPDAARGTYPPHCMGRSHDPAEREGAYLIEPVRPATPVVLEVGASPERGREVARLAFEENRPVFIRKNRFDVFEGNPATEAFVDALEETLGRALEFFVVGVARDVCVTGAVDGLQDRGRDVVAVRDATWGLGLEEEEETLARWARRGRVATLEELSG